MAADSMAAAFPSSDTVLPLEYSRSSRNIAPAWVYRRKTGSNYTGSAVERVWRELCSRASLRLLRPAWLFGRGLLRMMLLIAERGFVMPCLSCGSYGGR